MADGRLAWKVPRNYECAVEGDQSYATPLVSEHRGREAIIVWGAEHLTAHDAPDGSTLWTCGGFNPDGVGNWVTVASAVLAAGNVIVPFGRGAFLAGIRADGEGDVTATHKLWAGKKGSNVSSPIYHAGHLYWMNDSTGVAHCVNARTGEFVGHSCHGRPVRHGNRQYRRR